MITERVVTSRPRLRHMADKNQERSTRSLVAQLIALALVSAGAYLYFRRPPRPGPPPDPCPVSRAMAAQVRAGMTKEQVVQIVGCEPRGRVNLISDVQARAETAGGHLKEKLIWNSSTGRLEVACDRSGRVINSWFTPAAQR